MSDMIRIQCALGIIFCCVAVVLAPFATASGMQAADLSSEYETPPKDSVYVPEGLEATLWAESPMMYNPTNIDVDEEGRVWVLETLDYRNFNNDPDEHLSHPEGERVMILEDTDGDGKADDSKVFARDEELTAHLGRGHSAAGESGRDGSRGFGRQLPECLRGHDGLVRKSVEQRQR